MDLAALTNNSIIHMKGGKRIAYASDVMDFSNNPALSISIIVTTN